MLGIRRPPRIEVKKLHCTVRANPGRGLSEFPTETVATEAGAGASAEIGDVDTLATAVARTLHRINLSRHPS